MTEDAKTAQRLPPREVYFAWFDDLGWLDQVKHSMPLDVLHGPTDAQDAWVLAKWKAEHIAEASTTYPTDKAAGQEASS